MAPCIGTLAPGCKVTLEEHSLGKPSVCVWGSFALRCQETV